MPRSDVGDRLVVVLEVVLGPAQVVERLQARRQLGVGEAVDLRERLLAVLARAVDVARGGLAEAQRRRGRGDERAVAQRARGLERAAAHRQRLLEVELVQPVHGELDLQRRRRRRSSGRAAPPTRADEAAVRFLVPPSQCSTAAQSVVSSTRRTDRLGREQVHRLEQRRAAALELAERAQRRGERHAHRRPGDRCRALGSSRSAAVEPARGRGRGARGGSLACLEQHRDRVLVAAARRLLDVVRLLGRPPPRARPAPRPPGRARPAASLRAGDS